MNELKLQTIKRCLSSISCAVMVMASACSTGSTPVLTPPAAAMPVTSQAAHSGVDKDSLYLALGGAEGIELLADNFIVELAADDRVRHRYEKSDIGRFHSMMQLQMCELSGGPCRYTGDNMKRTHGGMNITSVEFNAVVEALMRAMDNSGLNPGVQNRLLAIMAPMRADIVGQ